MSSSCCSTTPTARPPSGSRTSCSPSLSRPFVLKDREVFSTASIGIVTSDQCLESAEAVVRNADVAMYEAKRSGRARAVVFDDAMRARLTRYVTIDGQLRAALETEQFSLVYQPIVELHTGRVTSVEALARWNHPTLGTISPAEFIPVAEESGLIAALGQRVLEEACAALADWRAQDADRAPETICVNISRAELALGRRLLERVSDTLFRFGLPPQCLRLEVTERDAMRDPEATLQLYAADARPRRRPSCAGCWVGCRDGGRPDPVADADPLQRRR